MPPLCRGAEVKYRNFNRYKENYMTTKGGHCFRRNTGTDRYAKDWAIINRFKDEAARPAASKSKECRSLFKTAEQISKMSSWRSLSAKDREEFTGEIQYGNPGLKKNINAILLTM
jgi:hypothetical protein